MLLPCYDALVFQVATQEMIDFLQKLKQKCYVGIVGGSDLTKIAEQMGSNGKKKT